MRSVDTGRFVRDKSILERKCAGCGGNKTYVDKTGRIHWRFNDGKPYCSNCYWKWAPRGPSRKKWQQIGNARKIKFLGIRVYLPWDFRKYVCSWCSRPDKMTDMHHLAYWPCMPWVGMVELCRKCHQKTKKISNQYLIKRY